jgi:excisionase family DNA binding protein
MTAPDSRSAVRTVSERGDLLLQLKSRPPVCVRAIEPRLLGLDDLAVVLAISLREVKKLVQRGDIKTCKIGSRRLCALEDVDAFINVLRAKVD